MRELAALTLESEGDELDYRDDGYIELVLKILGLMCDGQNRVLQVFNFINDLFTYTETDEVSDPLNENYHVSQKRGHIFVPN